MGDVSRVETMQTMFLGESSDIYVRVLSGGTWFTSGSSFNSDVSKWDVSRVTNMWRMFNEASSFNQTLCGEAWVNSKADKTDMFEGSPGSISTTVCAPLSTAGYSPQTRDDLKRAVNSC